MIDDPPDEPPANGTTLLRGPRPIRRVEPPDAPWPGFVADDGSGGLRLLVDRELLTGWPGWGAAVDGHVLGPTDIVRRQDGHDVVLPLCVRPLETFLEERARIATLSEGEIVTLAVSLLRGVAELRHPAGSGAAPDVRGTWWITDAGRPVFVAGVGDAASTSAIRLLNVSEHLSVTLASALDRCVACLRLPRCVPREFSDAEAALFSATGAEPLSMTILAPSRDRPASAGLASGRAARAGGSGGRTNAASSVWWAEHLDAGLAELVSATLGSLRARLRASRERGTRPRRRAIFLAGAVGSAVLLAGLLWPTGSEGSASAGTDRASSRGASATESAPPPPPTGRASTQPSAAQASREPTTSRGSIVDLTGALLDARLACAEDGSCLAALTENPGRSFSRGAASAPSTDRILTLLDDFGGAAVLRAENRSGGLPSQYIVVVRENDGWLLRDISDVGQQPSGKSD
ncbi:hypothetical protein [Microbacterium sp.]|uniref:hypothetical protein n=1 Tax=Microbacterium sp. TaxID=51671 RepID=UPI0009263EB8|nr:hypothetical protein [Microbacterium sp.]MBN9191333.1 hypothetical protein [Microbacterium sp.]OJU65845.1 MAG: hypothetical protein BGO04_01330 [Microbacterium sp. 70-38]